MKKIVILSVVIPILFFAFSCSKKGTTEPAYITPEVSFSDETVHLNSAVEVEYSFTVSEELKGKLPPKLVVFVHFLDPSGNIVFQDDHPLPKESSQLSPGDKVSYTRFLFIPSDFPLGQVKVKLGLYNKDGRILLDGVDEEGDRAYTVANLKVAPEDLNKLPIYKDGWYPVEYQVAKTPSSRIEQWSWTKKEATFSFLNPGKDSTLYLCAHSPVIELEGPQKVKLMLNGKELVSFEVISAERFWKKIELPKDIMGEGKWLNFTLKVNRTFVPAKVGTGDDTRELGLQVFHLCLK